MRCLDSIGGFVIFLVGASSQSASQLADLITHHIAEMACIATLVTAFATWCTVREIKKQRLSAQRPDIVIPEKRYKIVLDVGTGSSRLKFEDENINLGVSNIGSGHAKHINIQWKYDLDKVISLIKRADLNKLYVIKPYKIAALEMVDIQSNDQYNIIYRATHNLDGQARCQFHSMLRNTDLAAYSIQIPFAYLELYLAMLSLCHLNASGNEEMALISLFPKLYADIQYSDIENNIYHTKYQIQLDPFNFTKSLGGYAQGISEVSWGVINTEEIK